jgi:predicted DNA binding CopG/RHH family protein
MNERQRNMTKKSIPKLMSDEEAEAFLDQDLTAYLDRIGIFIFCD